MELSEAVFSYKEPNQLLTKHIFEEGASDSVGYGLTVQFSKNCETNCNGIFTESGLIEMLQASDVESLDKVSPFVGAITDRSCEQSTTSPVTKVCTNY